ncbi:MAG: molybdenum cofactor guanylyltransferase, partial [Deltaproteobacteria bacterium]|nr:molybdenum cofactor guanylyltransferase [Deltaproteobacteria bacterium]
MEKKHAMTAAILIGGASKRLGTDKVVLRVGDDIMVNKVLKVIQPLFEHVIMVGHPRKELKTYRIIEDMFKSCGPLGGIYTALSLSESDYVFVFAADMPYVDPGLVGYMISIANGPDIIIPVWSKGLEPLHAIYHKRLIPLIKSSIDKNCLKIATIVDHASVFKVPEEKIREFGDPDIIFTNINTTSDIEALER